jgi:hypothetical protein
MDLICVIHSTYIITEWNRNIIFFNAKTGGIFNFSCCKEVSTFFLSRSEYRQVFFCQGVSTARFFCQGVNTGRFFLTRSEYRQVFSVKEWVPAGFFWQRVSVPCFCQGVSTGSFCLSRSEYQQLLSDREWVPTAFFCQGVSTGSFSLSRSEYRRLFSDKEWVPAGFFKQKNVVVSSLPPLFMFYQLTSSSPACHPYIESLSTMPFTFAISFRNQNVNSLKSRVICSTKLTSCCMFPVVNTSQVLCTLNLRRSVPKLSASHANRTNFFFCFTMTRIHWHFISCFPLMFLVMPWFAVRVRLNEIVAIGCIFHVEISVLFMIIGLNAFYTEGYVSSIKWWN